MDNSTPDFAERLNNIWSNLKVFAAFFLAIAIFLLLLGAAFAQDGGTALPAPLAEDPIRQITGTAEAIAKGNGWMAAAGIVSLLTWALRSGLLKRLGKPGLWLYENPVAALATPIALSAVLGVITEFANGTPFTWASFLSTTVKVGAGAIAAFIGVEKIKEAKNAGVLAASGITTQQQALDELARKVIKGETVVPPPAPPVA